MRERNAILIYAFKSRLLFQPFHIKMCWLSQFASHIFFVSYEFLIINENYGKSECFNDSKFRICGLQRDIGFVLFFFFFCHDQVLSLKWLKTGSLRTIHWHVWILWTLLVTLLTKQLQKDCRCVSQNCLYFLDLF